MAGERWAGGGQGGIRTHDTVSRIHAFQASAFSHSATCPWPCHGGPRGLFQAERTQSVDMANASGCGDVVALELRGALAERRSAEEIGQRLRSGQEIVALAQR